MQALSTTYGIRPGSGVRQKQKNGCQLHTVSFSGEELSIEFPVIIERRPKALVTNDMFSLVLTGGFHVTVFSCDWAHRLAWHVAQQDSLIAL